MSSISVSHLKLPYVMVSSVSSACVMFESSASTVAEFAKKTGDYPSLSAVDLQLIALTYQLELERGKEKGDNLRSEPLRNVGRPCFIITRRLYFCFPATCYREKQRPRTCWSVQRSQESSHNFR